MFHQRFIDFGVLIQRLLVFFRLNELLSQTSAYSEFLINKVPDKIRKQLSNTSDKVSASFETQKRKEKDHEIE